MAAPKMTRHDMKQDDLVTFIDKASAYTRQNPTQVRNVGLAVAGVLALIAIVYFYVSSQRSEAETMLFEAQARFSAPAASAGTPPNAPAPAYANDTQRDTAALESFTKLAESHGTSRQGRLSLYYQGVLLARLGRNDEAKAALEKYIAHASNPLLTSLARAQLGQVLARTGQVQEATKIYSDLAEDRSSGYPRDWALFFLAEAQARDGKKAEAQATYQKIVTEFPSSSFIAEATRRAKGTS